MFSKWTVQTFYGALLFFPVTTPGTNNTAMCVHYACRQLGACGCWWIFDERMDPLPGQVEYSVHTQMHIQAHTDKYTHTYVHTHTRWHSFSAVPQLRQAGASEGDIRAYCITPDEKHTRMWCLLVSMVSILEIIGTHTQGHIRLFASSFQVAWKEY